MSVEPELLTLAQHILKTKEARFDPTKFVDRYEQAVLEMLDKKKAGLPAAPVKAFAPPRNVPDLFEAFRQSLAMEAAANDAAAPAKAKPKKVKPRVEDQKEMLLPIAGKKTEEKKRAQTSPSRRKAG